MGRSLTGATATIHLSVETIFNTPLELQGFATDDVFSSSPIKSVETLMGVDGKMSAGFVFVEIPQTFMLQADSASCDIFDQWWAAMQVNEDVYFANGIVYLKALGTKWAMTRGVLSNYEPIPAIKKLIQPRKFEITWNSISPSPT